MRKVSIGEPEGSLRAVTRATQALMLLFYCEGEADKDDG